MHKVLVAMRDARSRSGVGRSDDALGEMVAVWSAQGAGPRPTVQQVTPEELTSLLGTADHQGVAAEVDPYPYLEEAEILAGYTLTVALDGVQDPHNLGAVIRTAECVGAAVVIPRHRAVEVTPAVVRASAGATEHAAVAQVRNLGDFLCAAKEAGFWVYGAAAGAGAPYGSEDFTYPTCFVLGSEGEGLGRRVSSLCDALVHLPLLGKVGSLNVSVTAGVLLYEALRQRASGRAGTLSDRVSDCGEHAGAGQGEAASPPFYPDEGG